MATVMSTGNTDTPIDGCTGLTLTRGELNFPVDFREIEGPKNEFRATNITCPIDQPEVFRLAHSKVNDVYKSTNINSANQAGVKEGISILGQMNRIRRFTDDTDASIVIDIPSSVQIVVKTGVHPALTNDMLIADVSRAVSLLFSTGSETSTRMGALVRGSLEPEDM